MVHGRKRRIMSQGFSDASLKAYEPAIVERIDTLCRRLGEKVPGDEWSATFNMADWCMFPSIRTGRKNKILT